MVRRLNASERLDAAAERYRFGRSRAVTRRSRALGAAPGREGGRAPAGPLRPLPGGGSARATPAGSLPPRRAPNARAGRAPYKRAERRAAEPDRELFERYLAAKKARGEDVSGYRLEGFVEGLERERRKVRERSGGDESCSTSPSATAGSARRAARGKGDGPGLRSEDHETRRVFGVAALVSAGAPGGGPGVRPGQGHGQATSEPFYRQYLDSRRSARRQDRSSRSSASRRLPNDAATCATISATCSPQRRFPKEARAEQYEKALEARQANFFLAAYNLGLMRETEGKLVGRHLGVPEVDRAQARLPAVALPARPALRARPAATSDADRASTPRRCGSTRRCATAKRNPLVDRLAS